MTRVIVVDDDPTNVQLTKMLLELDGFDVSDCTSVQQAMEAAGGSVAAYVVDVNLARGESGLDLLRAVRGGLTGSPADTPVIVTSGDSRREMEALASGANHFLLKPYPPEKLTTIMIDLTEKRGNG